VAIGITDPDLDRDTDKMCLGGGMQCTVPVLLISVMVWCSRLSWLPVRRSGTQKLTVVTGFFLHTLRDHKLLIALV